MCIWCVITSLWSACHAAVLPYGYCCCISFLTWPRCRLYRPCRRRSASVSRATGGIFDIGLFWGIKTFICGQIEEFFAAGMGGVLSEFSIFGRENGYLWQNWEICAVARGVGIFLFW